MNGDINGPSHIVATSRLKVKRERNVEANVGKRAGKKCRKKKQGKKAGKREQVRHYHATQAIFSRTVRRMRKLCGRISPVLKIRCAIRV